MIRVRILSLLAFSCATKLWAAASPEPEVLSVCAALKNIERLTGKLITIKGVVAWDRHHGMNAISQAGIDLYTEPCPGIERRKRTWPPALEIRSPQEVEHQDPAVAFKEEPPTLEDLASTVRKREEAIGKDVAVATITGEVRTRKGIKIQRRGDDIIGNGYGQAGALPAMLIVKTVISVEDAETHEHFAIGRSMRYPK
jgi:hypothetical protein